MDSWKFLLVVCAHIVCTSSSEDKRAPSGFNGVRGKKDSPELDAFSGGPGVLLAYQDSSDMDKRAPSGFQGMRGKKQDFEGPWSDDGIESDFGNFEESDLMDKRAPSAQFLGMRGKKLMEPDNEADVESLIRLLLSGRRQGGFDRKRAPSSAFYGMRGKKSYDPTRPLSAVGNSNSDLLWPLKRAPSGSGFFGVRGKRSIRNSIPGRHGSVEVVKSPNSDWLSRHDDGARNLDA